MEREGKRKREMVMVGQTTAEWGKRGVQIQQMKADGDHHKRRED